MKTYNKMLIYIIILFVIMVFGINFYLNNKTFTDNNKEYRVSINRIERDIDRFEEENKIAAESLDRLGEYPYITGIKALSINDYSKLKEFIDNDNQSYIIYVTDSNYYQITYNSEVKSNGQIIVVVNFICGILFLVVIGIIFYIRQKIIMPFNQFTSLPYELSKGNLSVPLKEDKNRFFGKFLWGMDLLRDNLEDNKKKELDLQKEKKMLLLSLSHDIKTPLSAIKLYSKAISRNLYKTEEKKSEILNNIDKKADEIEGYISEIVKASNEDFLEFEVNNTEFYIGDVLDKINKYYCEKMSLNQIDFKINEYGNCLVMGDKDRLVEVIQNVIENSIKYGDNKKIWLDIEHNSEEYVIKISNTGCTLEEKELPHIFDSFFRGSNVEKKPGSGLGLFICRKLMHLMEGEVLASVKKDCNGENVMEISVVVRLA